MSFTSAVDAVVDSILNPTTPHVFVSINLTKQGKKSGMRVRLVESLDAPVRPRFIRDSQTELEFENGSRLISYPCRPVRGIARARVYLDELAHYQRGLDRDIYLAALPPQQRGMVTFRLGSSPLGAKACFGRSHREYAQVSGVCA
jgi:hypothetical protein